MRHFLLRPFGMGDPRPPLVRHANDPTVAAHLTDAFPHPCKEAHDRAFIEQALQSPPLRRCIEVDGACAGAIGLHPKADLWRRNKELGYRLARAHYGKGIMTEAIRQMVQLGFEAFPEVTRIYATPFGSNIASQRALAKAGFTLKAKLICTLVKSGMVEDEWTHAGGGDRRAPHPATVPGDPGTPLSLVAQPMQAMSSLFKFMLFLPAIQVSAQNTFEITIPVPGLTNVAGGHQLPDGGFVFGGELSDGLVVVRTDSTGAVLWTRTLAESANEEGIYDRSIAVSGDRIFMGGYAIGPGTASRDGILHVLDLKGNVLSQRLIDVAGGSNAVHTITGTADGALVAGRREGAGSYDMLLQQVDLDGDITGSWGYGSNDWDWAYEAIALANGDMALVGYGDGVGGPGPSAYLVRMDAQGNELWARGLDGASADEAYSVMEDPATGDLYIGGRTLGMGQGSVAGFISKFDAAGAHQWTRVIGNAFDVIGMVPSGGRFAALLRAQNIAGGFGDYDELLVFFSGAGDLLGSRLFGTTASDYAVSLAATPGGGLLISSFRSGPAAIRAVLTDHLGNGACTGTSVQVSWAPYTPAVFNHTSAVQSGSTMFSWITPSTQPSLTRQFVCCTYPVEASFEAQPGNALVYTFFNTSTSGGEASWSINGVPLNGDTVEFSFSAPGTYNVCLTVQGVCAVDTDCQTVNVATTGMTDHADPTSFTLQPNPATDRVRLTSASPLRRVELLDATGRVVRTHAALGTTVLELDIATLRPGAFVLRAWTDAGPVQRVWMKV